MPGKVEGEEFIFLFIEETLIIIIIKSLLPCLCI